MNWLIRLTLIVILCSPPLTGTTQFGTGRRIAGRYCGLTLGLDPYESYVSTFISLTRKRPPSVEGRNEVELYWKLFLRSFLPRFVLLQATDYPLTHLGAALNRDFNDAYHAVDISLTDDPLNIFEILGSGYEEPFAFSLFTGYLTPFWQTTPSGKRKQTGSASSGFVFTTGRWHIWDMQPVADRWYEYKLSLKGDRGTKDRHFKWNLEAGIKLHGHPGISDAVFYRYYRDHLDKGSRKFSLYRNSSLEYRGSVPVRDPDTIAGLPDFFSSQYLDIGKKFPSRKWPRIVYLFNTGISWQRYEDPLTGAEEENFSVFVRPNVLF